MLTLTRTCSRTVTQKELTSPYYTEEPSATAVLEEEADGNHYAALRANRQYSGWTHTGIYTNLVDGATYKFTGRYKSLGGYNGLSDGGSIMFNVNFDGKILSPSLTVDGNPGEAIKDHENGFNHNGSLALRPNGPTLRLSLPLIRPEPLTLIW